MENSFQNPFRFLWNHRDTLLLAFLLAVAVWASAVIASDPNREDPIENGVELQVFGLSDSLTLSSPTPKVVDVNIRAPESLWLEIEDNPGLVQARIDLTNVEKGEYTLPVEVLLGVSPAEVVSVSPATVSVIIEAIVKQEMTPIMNQIGGPAEGFEIQTGGISINNNENVIVEGPESRMKLVENVAVNVSVSEAKDSISTVTNLIAVDQNGRQVSGVTITPSQVSVTVQIVQSGGYRDVAVQVDTIGQPASGYTVIDINVNPPTITVYSPISGVVENMPGVVSTQPLDLTGISEDVDVRLGVVLPEGVEMVGTEQSVQVKVVLEAITSNTSLNVPVNALGLGPGLAAELSPTSVTVFLTGPAPVMDSLTANDIVVFVSLDGLEAGSHLITLEYNVLVEGVEITSISPEAIEVTIVESGGTEGSGGLPTQTMTPDFAITPEPTETPTPTPTSTPDPNLNP